MDNVELLDARIYVDGERLVLENSLIRREILLYGNLFATSSLVNLSTGYEWCRGDGRYIPQMANDLAVSKGQTPSGDVTQPAITFAGDENFIYRFKNAPDVHMEICSSPLWEQPSLIARVEIADTDITLTRFYQIYPGCPATICWTVVKGGEQNRIVPTPDCDNRGRSLRPESTHRPPVNADLHDSIFLHDRHLRIKNIILEDCTDYADNYVQEEERYSFTTFHPWMLKGNMIFAESMLSGEGMFMIKESPVLQDQPDNPDGDFTYSFDKGMIGQVGWGIAPEEISRTTEISSWRTVTGVYDSSDAAGATAVKHYLSKHSMQKPGRDWLLMCNQWGDCSYGRNFSEDFIKDEIDACARLGIPAYMLDAGWESGDFNKVHDTLPDGSSIFYDNGDYWAVDEQKFPHGLKGIVDYAKSKGVRILFWFNPDPLKENKNYRKDADTLLKLYRDYGCNVFKIDGVWNITRRADMNDISMLESVIRESNGEVSFQLDITNGARWGYLYAHHLGLSFMENRCIRFRNYLPYRVHKNLWELSRYLMPQRLQFEFVNNSPGRGEWYQPIYSPGDPFTAEKYPIDYLFAIVMFSNPLAWMEPSALTMDQLEKLKPVIEQYNRIRDDMFEGDIFPIGEKPSGRSITGFQSHHRDGRHGYVCAYREVTPREGGVMKLRQVQPGSKLSFNLLAGQGEVLARNGEYFFNLPDERSYALFKYEISD